MNSIFRLQSYKTSKNILKGSLMVMSQRLLKRLRAIILLVSRSKKLYRHLIKYKKWWRWKFWNERFSWRKDKNRLSKRFRIFSKIKIVNFNYILWVVNLNPSFHQKVSVLSRNFEALLTAWCKSSSLVTSIERVLNRLLVRWKSNSIEI